MAAAPPVSTCIEPEDFAAFIAGMLDESARNAIELHIDACAGCRELLSALAKTMHGAKRSTGPRRPLRASPASMSPTLPWVRDEVELQRGACVGRYVLLERLGAGAMGVVYAAHDPELNRSVALKVLRDHAASPAERASLRDRLRREAQAMAQLAHPNVVTVHDVGDIDGHVCIAMEFVDGATLTQWLRAKQRSLRRSSPSSSMPGAGSAAAHAAGLVHRDFKPDNVLVGNDGRVRVTDFGLAHRNAEATPSAAAVPHAPADARRTATPDFAGTPYYMAPEQYVARPTDARANQFSFCVALYSAVTGEHPFGPSSAAELVAAVEVGRPCLPLRRDGLPRWLRRVLWRGLSICPADRHASMTVLLGRLAYDGRRGVWLGAAAAACVAMTICGLYAWRLQSARLRCRGFVQRLDGAWDAPRQHALARAFRATGAPRWSVLFHEAQQRLARYSAEWVTLRSEACEAAFTGGNPTLLERRVQCLDARLLGLASVADRLGRVDGPTIGEAAAMTQDLGDLAVCLDDDALARMAQPALATAPTPAVAVDGAGALRYVVRRNDGTLWYGWRAGDAPGDWRAGDAPGDWRAGDAPGDWRAGDAPGGWRERPLTDGVAGDPALLLGDDGRLSYFVRKRDGWLWRGWQSGGEHSAWQMARVAPQVIGRPSVLLDGASSRRTSYARATERCGTDTAKAALGASAGSPRTSPAIPPHCSTVTEG